MHPLSIPALGLLLAHQESIAFKLALGIQERSLSGLLLLLNLVIKSAMERSLFTQKRGAPLLKFEKPLAGTFDDGGVLGAHI